MRYPIIIVLPVLIIIAIIMLLSYWFANIPTLNSINGKLIVQNCEGKEISAPENGCANLYCWKALVETGKFSLNEKTEEIAERYNDTLRVIDGKVTTKISGVNPIYFRCILKNNIVQHAKTYNEAEWNKLLNDHKYMEN